MIPPQKIAASRQRDGLLRLAIAGGGTGGHVLPAIAVIEELRRLDRLEDAVWIGSHDGFESQAAADAVIRFVSIPTGKFRRYLSPQNLTDAVRVPLGIAAARRILRTFRPAVVFSTGGFVSVPAVIAARGIAPVLTHEQTAILGLATRINARFASVLAISYVQTRPEADKVHRHVVVTGNPVRAGLRHGDRGRGLAGLGFDSSLPVVYVTGGARGASPLNERVAAMLPGVLERTQIVHQTGPAAANRDAEKQTQRRAQLPEHLRRRYKVVEYVGGELPDVYAATDLVIGRAGAGAVAELAYVGLPAILIPLPGAGGDEQAVNARVLSAAGAAIVIAQGDATPHRLESELLSLLADPPRLAAMSAAARGVAGPDATSRLAAALFDLAAQTRQR